MWSRRNDSFFEGGGGQRRSLYTPLPSNGSQPVGFLFCFMLLAAGHPFSHSALCFPYSPLKTLAQQPDVDHRALQSRRFDVYMPQTDFCRVSDTNDETFGPCDTTKFPVCPDGELICYNRRPSRSLFYQDIRQPYFYIDYRNVYCYPDTWQGCSSCSPGRLCLSENRCILQDIGYPCADWF